MKKEYAIHQLSPSSVSLPPSLPPHHSVIYCLPLLPSYIPQHQMFLKSFLQPTQAFLAQVMPLAPLVHPVAAPLSSPLL